MVVWVRLTADSKGVAQAACGSSCFQPNVLPEADRAHPARPRPADASEPPQPRSAMFRRSAEPKMLRGSHFNPEFFGAAAGFQQSLPKKQCESINQTKTAPSLLVGKLKRTTKSASRHWDGLDDSSPAGSFSLPFSRRSNSFGWFGSFGGGFSETTIICPSWNNGAPSLTSSL